MSRTVIVLVANGSYIPHAKALLVNCRKQGDWQGDFCLILSTEEDIAQFRGRGIDIHYVPQGGYRAKFELFSTFFRRWESVLYLDCDTLIQRDLSEACLSLTKKLPSILCDGGMYQDSPTIMDDWVHFGKLQKRTPEEYPQEYQRLRDTFPSIIDKPIYTSNAIFFSPMKIANDVPELLRGISDDFKEINPIGYDQQVTNLLLYSRMAPMTKDICSWFAFDTPGNRVASETRGWRGDEFPTIIHYWGMYAPWITKDEGAGGYDNTRLGRVCHDLYAENLAAFEETFPLF